jgi:hypothetical protein
VVARKRLSRSSRILRSAKCRIRVHRIQLLFVLVTICIARNSHSHLSLYFMPIPVSP